MSINWKGRKAKARVQARRDHAQEQHLLNERPEKPFAQGTCLKCGHVPDAHGEKRGSRGQLKSRPCESMVSRPTDDPNPAVFTVRKCSCMDLVEKGNKCTCGHVYEAHHQLSTNHECLFTGCGCRSFDNMFKRTR